MAASYSKILQKDPNFSLVAVNTNNRSFFDGNLGCPIFTDLEIALKKQEADCVVCATHPQRQLNIIETLVKSEIPAILEKPLFLSDPKGSGKDIASKIQSFSSGKFFVHHPHYFHAGFQKFIKEIPKNRIKAITIHESGSGPLRTFPTIFDWGVHCFCILEMLNICDWDIEDVSIKRSSVNLAFEKWTVKLRAQQKSVKNIPIQMKFGNGFKRRTRFLSVVKTDGSVRCFNFDKGETSQTDAKGTRVLKGGENIKTIPEMLDIFCKYIRAESSRWPHPSFDVALRSVLCLKIVNEYTRTKDI